MYKKNVVDFFQKVFLGDLAKKKPKEKIIQKLLRVF